MWIVLLRYVLQCAISIQSPHQRRRLLPLSLLLVLLEPHSFPLILITIPLAIITIIAIIEVIKIPKRRYHPELFNLRRTLLIRSLLVVSVLPALVHQVTATVFIERTAHVELLLVLVGVVKDVQVQGAFLPNIITMILPLNIIIILILGLKPIIEVVILILLHKRPIIRLAVVVIAVAEVVRVFHGPGGKRRVVVTIIPRQLLTNPTLIVLNL